MERGFTHGFGKLEANRELVKWMRQYNADESQATKVSFDGFDIPAGPVAYASPRQVLKFVTDFLCAIDNGSGQKHRERIESLIGNDDDWESIAGFTDPTKWIGLT